ncbi:zinc-dependent metalloprotease [Robiginitalea sp. SC105]|uniref:zinc-dependent metalloprotease n=1 Tax=Robiginitalea sp. SC105 TaxID=2762332 RepID=UPI00163AE4E1|nr:zinc-dependent metalloprotease [Robiginitalea sp. SC105]MBC2840682.1 zinc-dependent metalloprotease [Robiginitalea sp. SC105]
MKNRLALLLLLLCPLLVPGQFQEKSKDYQKFEGFFDFYYDDSEGKVYLDVDKLDTEFLYVYSLSSGIGSNDIGLDRGQLGNEQVVFFRKAGNKLLLIQPNLEYRAITENDLERKSVEQAFARSILFGFPIVETIGERHIVELTPFLMQDMHGVSDRLQQTGQGTYSLDSSKSAVNLERSRAFPKNIELDVLLTFKGDPKGQYIRSVAPNAKLVTVAQHHSLIELPGPGFEKRAFDARSGAYPFSYYDYATPVQEPIVKRFIPRHRLEKKDPAAAQSEAVEPIVYYLDNGTPEPVRSALLEGGRWWNQAFEAIGYTNAFQVKMLPDDADPLDVRYNVIQWVHRSTRGWSYGSSVADPRTGEIIKGHVSLGSLRIRQDFMIAQALAGAPFASSGETTSPMLDMALARIRQLSAHEIGHTLGFAHNFAASTNGRASVMDYPHPYIGLEEGRIDFSDAYDTGIGEWDKVIVAYAYSDFPEGTDEGAALAAILRKAEAGGLRYISDRDARPAGGAHAYGHLWDNGAAPADELDRVLEVRRRAMEQFSPANIREGEPFSVLEDVFVPLYFFHRYQTEAVSKLIGGLDYNYAVRGQEADPWMPVPAREQEKALESILHTLEAPQLAIPEKTLQWFPPRAMGYQAGRESFKGRTGPSFDALGAAETSADMTLGFLLHPERASRLVHQHALDPSLPGLDDLLGPLVETAFESRASGSYEEKITEVVGFRTLEHLMVLAKDTSVHPQVNAIAQGTLDGIRGKMLRNGDSDIAREMVRRIDRFREHPELFKVPDAPKIPDGSPIGSGCFDETPMPWR